MKNTNETKHTPGPWKAIYQPGRQLQSIETSKVSTSIHYTRLPEDIEGSANAQLIAAAPEMLEALRTALNNLGQCSHPLEGEERCYCQATTQIQDAIAKATGQTT